MFVVMCRPDGEKKAYVRLLADYDALDVANKVRNVNSLSLSVTSSDLIFHYLIVNSVS